MLTTISRAFRIMPGRRLYWGLLVGLAVFVSLMEMVGAVIVYVLLELAVNPQGNISLPLVGDVARFFPGSDRETVIMVVVIGMALFTLARATVKVAARYIEFRVAHNAGARLSKRLAEGYLNMAYSAHLTRNSSELVRNAREGVTDIVTGIISPTIKVLAEALIMLGLMVVLVIIDPVSTAIAAGVLGVVAAALLLVVQPRLKRIGQLSHQQNRETYQTFQQALHGIRDIKVLGLESAFSKDFGRAQVKLARARYLKSTFMALPTAIIEASVVGLVLLLFAVAILTNAGSEDLVATLGLFAYAGMRLQPSMQQIVKGLNDIKHADKPLEDVYADIDWISSAERRSDETKPPVPFRREIKVDNVSFTYEGASSPALDGIDFTIRPGEQIGVCGPTGGGKTTLIDLITGLLEPTTGQITVDGMDISRNTRSWQRNLGVVPQMVFITDDTVRRNIALGVDDRSIDDRAVERAIELAQLESYIQSLPAGLDTVVGERGVRISGGQRQRLAIARALYRDPSILIFDEGTSALDNVTESELLRAVNGLRGIKTTILIAHRLASVRGCDKVIFIEGGRISGLGPFDELFESNSKFRTMSLASDDR